MASHNTNKYAVPRIALIFFLVLTFFTFEKTFAQHSASRKDRSYTVFTETSLFWNSVAWNPDGKTIALAGNPGGVAIYNTDFKKLFQLEGTANDTLNMYWLPLVWSPDGTQLASIGPDALFLWSRSGELLDKVVEGNSIFWTLAWSPDSRIIAIGAADGLTLWSAETFKPIKTLNIEGGVIAIAWNPDGQKLILSIVGKDNPEIWDIKSGEKIGVLRGFTQAVGWSPDGKTIATQTEDYGCTGCHSIAFWDLSGTLLKILPSGDISVIKWSPDSRRVATNDLDAKVTIWNVTAGTHNLVFDDGLAPGVLGAQSSISWSPDGKYLAATSNHGHVLVWSSNPIKLIKDFS